MRQEKDSVDPARRLSEEVYGDGFRDGQVLRTKSEHSCGPYVHERGDTYLVSCCICDFYPDLLDTQDLLPQVLYNTTFLLV